MILNNIWYSCNYYNIYVEIYIYILALTFSKNAKILKNSCLAFLIHRSYLILIFLFKKEYSYSHKTSLSVVSIIFISCDKNIVITCISIYLFIDILYKSFSQLKPTHSYCIYIPNKFSRYKGKKRERKKKKMVKRYHQTLRAESDIALHPFPHPF